MPLSIDVTSAGLDGGPNYVSNFGNPPPVTAVLDSGRWGFAVSDNSGVTIPKTALADTFFDSDKFTVSFAFKATDGANSAGEVLRIHQSLVLVANADGSFRLDFFNDQGDRTILNTSVSSALDGAWHDVSISYDDAQSSI